MKIVFRYVTGGGTAALVNLLLLYLFTDIFGIWYVYSSIISFTISVFIGFSMQKFWTFSHVESEVSRRQFWIYTLVSITNVFLNTLMIYVFTDTFGVYYLVSQIISGGLLAILSFLIYKYHIFT